MSYAINTLVDTDPDTMFKEIEASERSRESCLTNYNELLRNAQATEEWPEAMTFEYLSFMVGRIVQENPTVDVNSRVDSSDLVRQSVVQGLQQQIQAGQIDPMMAQQMLDSINKPGLDALASQHGLKRWIEQEDFRTILDRHCDNYLKSWSVGLTYIEPMKSDPSRRWPKTCMIDTRRYLVDSMATNYSERAWEGHYYDIPKPRLIDMAKNDDEGGWDKTAIASLTPSADDKRQVDRQQVRVYELWVPGYAGDEWTSGEPGYNGSILTLGGKKDGAGAAAGIEIRKPRPAYVPPWGPYTIYGCYNRTGSPWPMSPLLATFTQQSELQKHAQAMNINARQYKRVIICSDKNPGLAESLRNAPDHLVITVSDEQFDKNQVISQEIGGISDQQIKQYGVLKSALQRAMGMDDQASGKVDSSATATAVAVADEATSTRVSYIEGKFIAAVRNNLRTVLNYMVLDERVSFRLGSEVSDQLGMIEPWFHGGLKDGEIHDPDDLELVIDPYSMGRTSEQATQQKVTQFVELIVQMAPAMLQFPFVDWKKVVRVMTQVLNLPDIGNAIDFDQVKQMGAQQLAMQQQAGQQQIQQGQQDQQMGQQQAMQQTQAHQMGMAQKAVQMDASRVQMQANQVKTASNVQQLIQNRVKGAKK